MSTTTAKWYEVTLDPPNGATDGLKFMIELVEEYFQSCVNLMCDGTPSQPANLVDQLQEDKVVAPGDKPSEMATGYTGKLDAVETKTSEMKTQNDSVDGTTAKAYGVAAETLTKIRDVHEPDLQEALDGAPAPTPPPPDGKGTGKLTYEQEKPLYEHLIESIDNVYYAVKDAVDKIKAQAAAITAEEPSYPGTGPGTPSPSSPYVAPASFTSPTNGGAFDASTAGSTSTPSGDKATAMSMMKYLVEKHNMTPAQAAAIVANAKYESEFDVNADGDGGTAKGIFQWRGGRQAAFYKYASDHGLSTGNWETHVDFMVHEMKTNSAYQRAENSVFSPNTSAGQKAADIDRYYEISSGHTTGKRASYAEGLVDTWNASNKAVTAV